MNAKLTSIMAQAATDLCDFAREKEDEILAAWSAAEQEATDQEAKPKFKLGFAITLDLDKDHMETALSWSVRHKVSRDMPIPDPTQPQLDLDEKPRVQSADEEPTVRIQTGSVDTGEIPLSTMRKAVKKIRAARQNQAA